MNLPSLSPYEWLSVGISISGFVAVVITLVLLGRQTRKMTGTLRAAAHQADTAHMLEVDALFVNHPDMYPYFYAQKTVGSDHADFAKIQAVAGLLLDYFGAILYQRPHVPQIYPETWWDPYFVDAFANSPMLCSYLDKHVEYYPVLVRYKDAGETKRRELPSP